MSFPSSFSLPPPSGASSGTASIDDLMDIPGTTPVVGSVMQWTTNKKLKTGSLTLMSDIATSTASWPEDNRLMLADGASTKRLKTSAVKIDGSNNMTGLNNVTALGTITADSLTLTGSSIPVETKNAPVVDKTVPRYDGTDGKTIQSSLMVVDDLGDVTGVRNMTVDTLNITNATDLHVKSATQPVVDNIIPRYDGTDGKTIQDSLASIDDLGDMTGVRNMTVDTLTINNATDLHVKSATQPVTDNTLVRYDNTTGRVIQGSGAVLDDSDNLSVNTLSATANVNGTSFQDPTQTNGFLTPAGAGSKIRFTNSEYSGLVDRICTHSTDGTYNATSAYCNSTGDMYTNTLKSASFQSKDGNNGIICPDGGSSKVMFSSSEYQGTTNRMSSFDTNGNLQISSATLTPTGDLDASKVLCNTYNNNNDSAGITIGNTGTGAVNFTGSKYSGHNRAIVTVNNSGQLQLPSDNATVDSNGNIECKKLTTTHEIEISDPAQPLHVELIRLKAPSSGPLQILNKYGSGGSATKGVVISNTTDANIQFTGDKYQGVNGYSAVFDATGNITPVNITAGSVGTSQTYTDFRVKQHPGAETISTVYAQKIGEMITLFIPELVVATPSPLAPVCTYLTDVVPLHPATSVVGAGGEFVFETPNWFILFHPPTGGWPASSTIKGFTITYRSANATDLTTTVWGTAYPVVVTDIITPTTMTSNTLGTWTVSASSVHLGVLPAYQAFDGNNGTVHACLNSPGRFTAGVANSNDQFNKTGVLPADLDGPWLKASLGGTFNVNNYKFTSNHAVPAERPKSWILYGSSDDLTYFELHRVTDFDWAAIAPTDNNTFISNSFTQTPVNYLVLHITKIDGSTSVYNIGTLIYERL